MSNYELPDFSRSRARTSSSPSRSISSARTPTPTLALRRPQRPTSFRAPRSSTSTGSGDLSLDDRKKRLEERAKERKAAREAAIRRRALDQMGPEAEALVTKFETGGGSIANQFKDAVGSAPLGVADFAKQIGNVPWSLTRAAVDLSRNIPGVGDVIPGQSNLDQSGNWMQDIQAGFREYTPLLADMAGSVRRTANVTGIGSDQNIVGRYQDAVREGRWIQEVMEDAGNVALISGGAGAALGKGGVVKAGVTGGDAQLLGTSSRLGRPFAGRIGDDAVSLSSGARTARPGGARTLNRNLNEFKLTPPGAATERVPFVPRRNNTGVPGTSGVEAVATTSDLLGRRVGGSGLAGYLERRATGGAPNVPMPASAAAVERAGTALSKAGLTVDWLDPSTPLLSAGGSAVKGVGRGLGKVAPWVGNTAVGQRVAGWNNNVSGRLEQYRQAAAARSDLEVAQTNAQKAAIDAQSTVDAGLKDLGGEFVDPEVRDLYGGVILNQIDKRLDEITFKLDKIQDSGVAQEVLNQYNANRPWNVEPITMAQVDLYRQYQKGQLDPQVTRILDEGNQRLRTQIDERTDAMIAADKLLDEQLARATRISDGALLSDLSDQEIMIARRDDDIAMPYLETETLKMEETIARGLEREEAKLEGQRETVGELEAQVSIHEAIRLNQPQPGTNVPYENTLGGRQTLSMAEQMRVAILQQQLDSLLDQEQSMGPDLIPEINAEIRSIADELRNIQDPARRAELEGRSAELFEEQQTAFNEQTFDEARTSISDALAEQQAAADAAVEGISLDVNTTPDGVWEGEQGPRGTLPNEVVVAMEGPPPENTTLAASDAVRAAMDEGRLAAELETARREVWVTQQRIEAYQRKSANLQRDLGSTQQDRVRGVNRQGVGDLQVAVKGQTSVPVGEWKPNVSGPGGTIDGVIGRLARKHRITGQVIKRIQRMEKEMRKQWDEMPKKVKDDYIENLNVKSADQYIAYLSHTRGPGRINIAAAAFQDIVEGRKIDLGADQGIFNESLVTDELGRMLEPLKHDESLLTGFAAHEQLQASINHLPDELRDIAKNKDMTDRIDAAHEQFIARWERELNKINDQAMAATPKVYRTPVMEARKTVSALMTEARRQWDLGTPEGRDTANALELLTRDSPTSFEAYATGARTSGVIPSHLIGGTATGGAGFADYAKKQTTLEARPLRAEFKATTGERAPTLREYANLEAAQMTDLAVNKGITQIANNSAYSASMMEIIAPLVEQWRAEGGRGKLPFATMERWLNDAGYSVVRGTTEATALNRQPGGMDFTPVPEALRVDEAGTSRGVALLGDGRNIDMVELNLDLDAPNTDYPDVRVMPTKLAEEVALFRDKTSNRWLTMYDQMTQLWKTATLAWSTAWVTYNAIGNALMATFSAGMNPVDLVIKMDRIREAIRAQNVDQGLGSKAPLRTAMKNEGMSGVIPARLETHGLSMSERASIRQLSNDETRLGRVLDKVSNPDRGLIGRVTTFSYALNEFTDNMFRSAVYLDQLEKNAPVIPREYLTPEGRVRTDLDPAQIADLEVINTKAVEAQETAVKAALNTMGDFTRLTPFERRVVKRLVPFYPWLRHQTAMTFRMPLNNPLRWAYMASLDNIIGDDEDPNNVGMLMGMSLPLGGATRIPFTAASPFGGGGITALGGNEGSEVFSVESAVGVINPIAKLPFQMLGYDAQGNSISRPIEDKPINDFGSIAKLGPIGRIANSAWDLDPAGVAGGVAEGAYSLGGTVPQIKGIRDMLALSPALGGDQRPRYDDGSIVEHADNRQISFATQLMRATRMPFAPMDMTRQIEIAEDKDDVMDDERNRSSTRNESAEERRERRLAQIAAREAAQGG